MINKKIDLLDRAINALNQRPTTVLDSIEERVHFSPSEFLVCPLSLLEIFSTFVQRINPEQLEQGEEHNARSELCHNQIDLTETTLSERERERQSPTTNRIERFSFF